VFKRCVAAALRPGLVAALAIGFSAFVPQVARAGQIGVSPQVPLTNEEVTFTSAESEVTAQSWDLDGDGRYDDASGTVARWSFPTSGSYTVRLYGTYSGGGSFLVTQPVLVINRPPAAAFTYGPQMPLTGDSIALTSISADSDGPIVSQSWDLDGDGAFDDAQGPIASVTFADAGSYPVGLLVTDRDGASHGTAARIDVRARPPEAISPFPVVRIVGSFGEQGIKIEQLVVTAPDGARVEIRCRGRGCPFKKLIRKAQPQTVRVRRFAHRVLRPGAIVQVWVTRPGDIGKYTRLRIRKGKRPTRVDRCLMPGSKKPTRCAS
jgi:PKD domain-containing protein